MNADRLVLASLISIAAICILPRSAFPNTCADPIELDSLLPLAQAGSTVGAGNDYSGSCVSGTNDAPDVVYLWTPTQTGRVTVSTDDSGTSFDTGIYVRVDCGDGLSEVVCADEPGGDSLTFEAVDGTLYYIFVDGAGSAEGDFFLTLAQPVSSPVPMFTWTATALLTTLLIGAAASLFRPRQA